MPEPLRLRRSSHAGTIAGGVAGAVVLVLLALLAVLFLRRRRASRYNPVVDEHTVLRDADTYRTEAPSDQMRQMASTPLVGGGNDIKRDDADARQGGPGARTSVASSTHASGPFTDPDGDDDEGGSELLTQVSDGEEGTVSHYSTYERVPVTHERPVRAARGSISPEQGVYSPVELPTLPALNIPFARAGPKIAVHEPKEEQRDDDAVQVFAREYGMDPFGARGDSEIGLGPTTVERAASGRAGLWGRHF